MKRRHAAVSPGRPAARAALAATLRYLRNRFAKRSHTGTLADYDQITPWRIRGT